MVVISNRLRNGDRKASSHNEHHGPVTTASDAPPESAAEAAHGVLDGAAGGGREGGELVEGRLGTGRESVRVLPQVVSRRNGNRRSIDAIMIDAAASMASSKDSSSWTTARVSTTIRLRG